MIKKILKTFAQSSRRGANLNHKNTDIEALRAYAISITFVAHLGYVVPEWYPVLGFFWLGGGVDLFFCISGFVITKSLISKDYSSPAAFRRIFLPFWIKRISRLVPASLLTATSVLIISQVVDISQNFGSPSWVAINWLFSVTSLENIFISYCLQIKKAACMPTPLWHYWTLSLEDQFYFCLPILLLLLKPMGGGILSATIFSLATLQALTVRASPDLLWYIRSDAILFGCTIAMVWHFWPLHTEATLSRLGNRCTQVVSLILLVLLVVGARSAWTQYYMGVVSFTSCLIVFLASRDKAYLTSNRAGRFLLYIGSRSYSIYLVHFPVMGAIRHILSPSGVYVSASMKVMAVMLTLLGTFALAELLYRFVETPFRIRGRGVAEWISSKDLQSTIRARS